MEHSSLHTTPCESCDKDTKPLSKQKIHPLLKKLGQNWTLNDQRHLYKKFLFQNFNDALIFVNKVGEIAETINHHPILSFSWGYVDIIIYTHSINGLHINDFILAAKIDALIKYKQQ